MNHKVAVEHRSAVVAAWMLLSMSCSESTSPVVGEARTALDEASASQAPGLEARGGDDASAANTALRVWNELALAAVRATRAADVDAARTYAMVNVAMYDAVNGLLAGRRLEREAALVPPAGAPPFADPSAAVAAAAHAVLSALLPDQAAGFDAQLAADEQALASVPGATRGFEWGAAVGTKVVAARAQDGSRPVEDAPAGSGPGVFRAAWSNTQFRNLTPFAIADPAAYVSSPPPALASVAYAAALAEVKVLGNAANPDPDALATFQFWALSAGTVQPAGEWLRIALELAEAQRLGLQDRTRLFALVTMALADVVAPTIRTKFVYQHWRPATAIREADTDGNPLTDPDPSWGPRAGGIGSTPQHTSGHSAFSAAAATVLAGFFCRDEIAFSHLNDGAPAAQARSYPSFSAAAAEAGRSRIYGGQHFEFSNQAGLAAGRGVGGEVLANALLRKRGPTHFGACPL